MLAFKPKEEPLLTRIVKSGLFQFLMVLLLGVGVTYFVVRTDQPQQWIQRINRFASVSPPIQNQGSAQNTEAGLAEDTADLEAPPPTASTWAARSMVASASNLSVGSNTFAPAASGTLGASNTAEVSVSLSMAETEMEYLNSRMQRAFNASSIIQDSEIKVFIDPPEPNALQKKQTSSAIKLQRNEEQAFNYGVNNRGFTISMQFMGVTEGAYRFQIQFIKNHPNDDFRLPLDFSLRKGERLYIAGHALLHYFEVDLELFSITPFQILQSPDFKNQNTTFAITLELQ